MNPVLLSPHPSLDTGQSLRLTEVCRRGECRLIDWEEYGVSDLCYEVADVVEHASSRLDRRLNIDVLLAEFALDVAQRERLEHHRRMFACFWLAMLLPGNGGWHRNPPGSIEKQAQWVIEVAG